MQPYIGPRRRRIREISANADVAQLVEHFTRNEGVPGSIPGVGSTKALEVRAFSSRGRHGRGERIPKVSREKRSLRHLSADSVGRPTGHVFRLERVREPV
jgi:hypothetical protein